MSARGSAGKQQQLDFSLGSLKTRAAWYQKCDWIVAWTLYSIQFAFTNDKEKQQISTCEKLEPTNNWHFCLKYWLKQLLDYQNN